MYSQRCSGMNKNGTKCKRSSTCRWHRLVTCPICLDEVPIKSVHTTACNHKFHSECIMRWFVTSDDCPVCRSEQATEPIITFKKGVHDRMASVYMDAIRSLESEVTRYRRLLRAVRDD